LVRKRSSRSDGNGLTCASCIACVLKHFDSQIRAQWDYSVFFTFQGYRMINRTVSIWVTAAALVLSVSAFAGGKGGGSSHGGGNSGGGSSASHESGHEMGSKASHESEHKAGEGAGERHEKKSREHSMTDNKKLSAKLESLLPAGTDLQAAAQGFKNYGQFVAAVHVSQNLGIPFSDLKAKMMDGASLGTAIKALKPTANSELEAKKAQKQASLDAANTK
jgi:hypothetical protein